MNFLRKKANLILLILVLLAGLGIRLFDLFEPPLDYHSTRQLRSALIARSSYYNLLPSTPANDELRQFAESLVPYKVLEPPIFETLASVTYLVAGGEHLWLARIWAILFWLVGGIALFLILRRFFSATVSLLSLAFYLFLPFAIQASRAFQPDPLMVMWILLSILALLRWTEKSSWRRAIVAGLLGGATILIKVTAGLFLAGTYAIVILSSLGWKSTLRSIKVYLIATLTLLPFVIYYLVMNSGNSTSYFDFWTVSMSGMLLNSKFYLQWLTMIDSLFSLTMLIAAILGSLLAPSRLKPVLTGLWIGYIAYGLLWPFQYTTHDYYHLMLVPIIALSLAGLLETILQRLQGSKLRWAALGIFAAMAAFSIWTQRSVMLVNNYANEPESWRRVGAAIPADKHFAALVSDYGVRLNYYGWRKADVYWPNSADLQVKELRGVPIEDYRAYFEDSVRDLDLFLVTAYGELDNQPELKQILASYQVYYEGNGFIIYDLTKPLP